MIIYEPEDTESYPHMFYCEDLGSLNGTEVNGVPIGSKSIPGKPFLLSDGDIIKVQPYWTFRFQQPMSNDKMGLDEIQLKEVEVISHIIFY